jgi:serine/threonine protein kinase
MIQGKQGLLHRDVKPANIMLTHLDDDDDEQRILLADFGIARNLADVSGLTTTNMTVGTVAYSAPEQLMGEDVDGRADQSARVHAEQFGVERHLRALGLVPFAPSGDPLGAREFGTAGALARRERRLRLAEALWRQSLRRDVTNIRSSSSLGQLLHHQGRYAEAVDLLVPVADVDSYAHLFLGWSRLQLGLTEGDQDVAKQGLADVAAELKRWSLNASRTDRTPWLRNVRRLYLLGPDFRKEVDQLISFANSNANWPKVSAEEVKDVAKLEEDDVEPLAGLASTPADLLGPEAKK